jgi:hypothetical protein
MDIRELGHECEDGHFRIIYNGFIIGKGSPGWYVCREHPEYDEYGDRKENYLHKDNTFHNFCGKENFWSTPEAAKVAIDILQDSIVFITKEEFSP